MVQNLDKSDLIVVVLIKNNLQLDMALTSEILKLYFLYLIIYK